MKPYLYIIILAFLAISCSTSRLMTMEDDIYYIPGEKALVVKEIENTTGNQPPYTSGTLFRLNSTPDIKRHSTGNFFSKQTASHQHTQRTSRNCRHGTTHNTG